MIKFTTEMFITLPSPKEEDYYQVALENVKKFTEKFSTLNSIPTLEYDARLKKTNVTFQWNDAQYQGAETGEERCRYLLGRMNYWFKHCKFFRKHQVSGITTSYTSKV